MKIGILGYGKEGKSAKKYFKKKDHEIEVIDNFTIEELDKRDLSSFDIILRSPSVHPREGWSSVTKYFFEHCPCPIIGVTGTKGKGTICSLIAALLRNTNQNTYLVGNIGLPAIDFLDKLTPEDVVVYELSSFQLWDLPQSPHIAVVNLVEPDHLNIHDDYTDYVNAKANLTKHQTSDDYCIYCQDSPDATNIADLSPAHKLAYPLHNPAIDELTSHLSIPGQHNRTNAEAALLAVASFYSLSINDFIKQHHDTIVKTFENFEGLPHRLQFLRQLNTVKYYDDNFSTTPTSLEVALAAFPHDNVVLILGGRDKTNNADLPDIVKIIQDHKQVKQIILIGESGRELDKLLSHTTFVNSLPEAVARARKKAECFSEAIVLMSPAAASFDMFENVYDRGNQFQKLIQDLK